MKTLPLLATLLLSTPVLAAPMDVDFTAAIVGVNFNPATLDGNGAERGVGNGLPDAVEMALIAAVLADESIDLSATGGVRHADVVAGYEQAIAAATKDMALLIEQWSTTAQVSTGYILLGQPGFDFIDTMAQGFNARHSSDYSLALQVGELLGGQGDADGDGVSNLQEYLAFGTGNTADYIAAALDPSRTPAADQLTEVALPESTHKTIGILLYEGFEVLDVYGPAEMWANVPEFDVVMIAEEAGPVMSAQGIATIADYSFSNAPALDIVMVPGGIGTRTELLNENFLTYLQRVHATSEYTTSVCTGSALLAKAGILDGLSATSNKRVFYLAEEQSSNVDWVVDARWVESGKVLTSSGVSAGIDMALGLVAKTHGIESSRMLASSLEYVWHEDAGDDPFAQFARRAQTGAAAAAISLQRAEPAANAALGTAPQYLQLFFDAAPDVDRSAVMLQQVDGDGREIPLSGLHTMDNMDLMVSVSQPLAPGEYAVSWSSAPVGGGAQKMGTYRFAVE